MKEKRYTNDKSFARLPNEEHNPDYRIATIYPFYQDYLTHSSIGEVSTQLDEMVSSFQGRKLFKLKSYLEMYPTEMTELGGIGYFIDTDACPTLKCPPYPTSASKTTRMGGLIMAIEDIAETKDKILDAFEKAEHWKDDLEPKLKAMLHYHRKNRGGGNRQAA